MTAPEEEDDQVTAQGAVVTETTEADHPDVNNNNNNNNNDDIHNDGSGGGQPISTDETQVRVAQEMDDSTNLSTSIPTGRPFVAVRQCSALHGPAIFFSWQDARKFVSNHDNGDGNTNDAVVTYQQFATLHEAVAYLETPDGEGNGDPNILSLSRTSPRLEELKESSHKRPGPPPSEDDEEEGEKKKARTDNTDLVVVRGGLVQSIAELERQWDDLVPLLQDFFTKHGHGDVPVIRKSSKVMTVDGGGDLQQDDDDDDGTFALSQFVTTIRQYYKEWMELKQPPPKQQHQQQNQKQRKNNRIRYQLLSTFFTEERVRQLDAYGFVWTLKRGPKPTPKTAIQEEQFFYNKLVELKRIVFERKEPIRRHPKMQEWITKQRKEYQAYRLGIPGTTMTPDRIVALAQAGFTFEATKKRTWDERAVEWLQYKSKNGGKDPKRFDETGLGKWVYDQRDKYRQMRENGKKTNLTESQISRLTDWGFHWDVKVKVKENRAGKAPWEHRYGELVEYKEKYGTTLVPQNHPVLGQWVHSQRNHYRLRMTGRKSPMTDERLKKLNSIGFCFGTARGGAATVARKKALASTGRGGLHQSDQHLESRGDNDMGEDDQEEDQEDEHDNDNNDENTDVQDDADTSTVQRDRQDFRNLQHFLDWERYRNTGN